MSLNCKLVKFLNSLVNLILWCLFFNMLMNFSLVSAQDFKVGIFDLSKVMTQSQKVSEMRRKILQELDPKRLALIDKEITVKRLEERLRTEGARLSESERRALEDRFQKELQEYRVQSTNFQQSIIEKEMQLARQVMQDLAPALKKVAEEKKLKMILERNSAGLAYFDPTLDISDRLIKIYDGK